jgi:hypothetical protein
MQSTDLGELVIGATIGIVLVFTLPVLPAAWICRRTTGLNFMRWGAPTGPIRSRMPPCSGQSRPSPSGGRESRGQP